MIRFPQFSAAILFAGPALLATAPACLAQSSRSSTETVIGQPSGDDLDTRSEQVPIAAGELASLDGRDRVAHRIERAVRRVCMIEDTGNLAELGAYENCHATSLAEATAQMTVLVARNESSAVLVADAGPR